RDFPYAERPCGYHRTAGERQSHAYLHHSRGPDFATSHSRRVQRDQKYLRGCDSRSKRHSQLRCENPPSQALAACVLLALERILRSHCLQLTQVPPWIPSPTNASTWWSHNCEAAASMTSVRSMPCYKFLATNSCQRSSERRLTQTIQSQ